MQRIGGDADLLDWLGLVGALGEYRGLESKQDRTGEQRALNLHVKPRAMG
jgi:hypothetical protein